MKLSVLFLAAIITGLIALSSNSVQDFGGTWIMRSDNQSCNNTVLRIKMNEGIWHANMDIPDLELYDMKVYDIALKSDSVFITLAKNWSVIKARLVNDSTIAGNLWFEGNAGAVKFEKYKNQNR